MRDLHHQGLTLFGKQSEARNVVFVVLPQVHLLDLSGPAQVFDTARCMGAPYTLRYSSPQTQQISAQGIVLAKLSPLAPVAADDLILLAGVNWDFASHEKPLLDQETRDWLSSAAKAGAHIASVCTGTFALAEAGLLDGRRCTTHWSQTSVLQARFPKAKVFENVLFVHDGRLTTSAGIASGIDMALGLVQQDQGPMFAAQVARHLVVYLRRNGSQPQSSIYLEYRTHLHSGVHQAQDYLINHIAEHVTLDELANVAGISTRGLNRAFKEATGLTPIQYHQRLRIELAATLLSNPALRIEEVALQCGFEDVRHFRRLWQRQFGAPPLQRGHRFAFHRSVER
ncbi:GlxA family transcriptional regulator [Dictyobacter formicarum]|uniref:AraC family transcriptional regulator n=1 Tax=Dictyobacter formicarum TaxID=2778368 RepID=A0ABQ3V8S2_9CHLR|nr:helix-turn-helix domain-containing protein [Dictyobacter formicarum]GHO82527.1 AraC family transcriptional regulator [Dictyobacter formicarum]